MCLGAMRRLGSNRIKINTQKKCIYLGKFTAQLPDKSEYAPYLHSCEQGSPDKFSVVRNVNRFWFSLACLPCKRPGSGEILNRMNIKIPG